MKKRFAIIVATVMVGLMGVISVPVYADYTCDAGSARVKSGGSANVKNPAECDQPKEERELGKTGSQLINIILSILGIVAVLVIIVGGIMYATSNGDAGKVTQAKNIIQYALIGLIVALLAWAIVNFVLEGVFSTQS